MEKPLSVSDETAVTLFSMQTLATPGRLSMAPQSFGSEAHDASSRAAMVSMERMSFRLSVTRERQ
jgi:hypothetical protein